ncbi:MAG: hypothetical protein IT378_21115, partial [Sandaracinaceae bacterium]|nr:hypothetical protein [Sandaracinaceae bacterium]
MEAYSAPLRVLGEKVRSFVGLASEHGARSRLLHVATDALLRDAAIDIVMGFEHHADNWTPFVRLDEPYTEDGAVLSANAIVLAAQHEARREAMAKHGHELARLGTIAASSSPIARFAAALSAVLDAQRAPLAGLTLVLAPGGVEDPSALERDVLSLARSPGLAAVRFVIVELGARELGKELAGATRAERAQIAVDDNLACTELEQRLDAAGAASPDLP